MFGKESGRQRGPKAKANETWRDCHEKRTERGRAGKDDDTRFRHMSTDITMYIKKVFAPTGLLLGKETKKKELRRRRTKATGIKRRGNVQNVSFRMEQEVKLGRKGKGRRDWESTRLN